MGDKNFRLSPDVRPVRYHVRIEPELGAQAFSGHLTIELELARPVRALTLHAVELTVANASANAGGKELRATSVQVDAESETVEIAFDADLPAGPAKLDLLFSGKFSPSLRGLYKAGALAVTQFEAADARRMLPCFDEPSFKATWALEVVAPPSATVLSNGRVERDSLENGRRVVRFVETPKLSSYLVALVMGELAGSPPVHAGKTEEEASPTTGVGRRAGASIEIRSWAVPEKAALLGFAQNVAGNVLPLLEDYFGVPYAFGKLDQIAVPDFEAGAMENAGCITFREVVLLVDDKAAPIAQKKRVAEVITHEAAHQWFGNLVTMVWWDDLWLNEAFATWMAYKIVDQWKPEWRVWIDFEQGKAGALALDALESTHPIRAEVKNAVEASENFDAITYEKGGAVLRMLEGYLGHEKFREGVRRYIKRHAWGNATNADLWASLREASGQPIDEIASLWITKAGYPVVSVKLDGAAVTLSQKRFYSDPAKLAASGAQPGGRSTTALPAGGGGEVPHSIDHWLVPMVLKYRDDTGVKEERVLFSGAEEKFTLAATGPVRWLCANAGATGFYRVSYDAPALAKLGAAVAELGAVEKISLLGDQWALARAGATPTGALLDLIASFKGETDYTVLDEAVGRLAVIEHRLIADAERPAFQRLVEQLLAPQLEELGWDPKPGETDDVRLRRAAALRGLGLTARAPAVLAAAEERFARYLADRSSLDANLADTVTTLAARSGDAARFNDLFARLATETEPVAKRRFLLALASFEAPALVERAVGLTLTDAVALQDVAFYVMTLMGNRAAREQAWAFLSTNWEAARQRAQSPLILRRFIESLGSLPERRHLAQVEKFLAAHPVEAAKAAIAQTLERLRLDVAFRERAQPELAAWLRARA